MAGIMNHTARQFNLKTLTPEGRRVVVRIAPGFNVVDDEHFDAFNPKDTKAKPMNAFLKQLKKDRSVSFGKAEDDMELEQDPDTKSKSKSEKTPSPPKED